MLFEFEQSEYNFEKHITKNKDWNFYKSNTWDKNITLATKGYNLKLTDRIIVDGNETTNDYGAIIWVNYQKVDTKSFDYNLCLLSEVKGITEIKANEIFEASETKTVTDLLNYLVNNKIPGVGPKKIEAIKQKYEEAKSDNKLTQLYTILGNLKLANKLKDKIFEIEQLYENPYLILKSVRLGFKKIDEIARNQLNVTLDNPIRIKYLTEHKYTMFNTKKSTFVYYDDFLDYLINEIQYIHVDANTFIKQNDLLVVDDDRVYLKDVYEAETRTPELMIPNLFDLDKKIKIDYMIDTVESRNPSFKLSDEQKNALKEIIKSPKLSILTGEAGTGKSTITKYLCDILATEFPLLLLSPTGKAAGRMKECTNRDAHTIHRFCYANSEDANAFRTFMNFGIKDDFCLIIDEFSMVDQRLFYWLLNTIDELPFINCRKIIIIGDPYQLPSVGIGQVMIDMIESKVFTHIHLTQTFRQLSDSNIIKNAKLVRNREAIKIIKTYDFWVDGQTENNLKKFYYHFKNKYTDDLELFQNVQFVTSTNKERQKINKTFKKHPETDSISIGDKVINTKNINELGVSNGDFGIVENITNEKMIIYFYDINQRIELDKKDNYIELGYACTTHKLQGSEYKTIIIVLENNVAVSDYRSFYTAITRGKQNVIILAKNKKDIIDVCTRNHDYIRKTYFKERLKNFFGMELNDKRKELANAN